MKSVVNGFTLISPSEDPKSPNIPKVVTEKHLVYMSRNVLRF